MDAFWKLLRELNVERCEKHFHRCSAWSMDAWSIALAGEVGEALNEIKKLIRGDGNKSRLSTELADAVTYADLLLHAASYQLAASEPLSIDSLNACVEACGDVDDQSSTENRAERIGVAILRASRKLDLCGNPFLQQVRAIEAVGGLLPALWRGFALAGVSPERAVRDKFDEVSRRVGYTRQMCAGGSSAAVG